MQQFNTQGFTPLHAAAASGKSQAVELLLQRGADVNALNSMRQTPLFQAADSGNLSTIKAITERLKLTGLMHQDADGLTALHNAAEGGHADVIVFLIRLGNEANVDIIDQIDQVGRSPLHYACEAGRPNAVAALLEYGPDVDLQNDVGLTPLHCAAQNGHLNVVRLLRQYHAYVNAIAIDEYAGNVTALDYALQSQNEQLVEYLRQHGALTGKDIQHLAACKIQQYWRRYRRVKEIKSLQVGAHSTIVISFQVLTQFLMLKHESLRRDKVEIRQRLISQNHHDVTIEASGPTKIGQCDFTVLIQKSLYLLNR